MGREWRMSEWGDSEVCESGVGRKLVSGEIVEPARGDRIEWVSA